MTQLFKDLFEKINQSPSPLRISNASPLQWIFLEKNFSPQTQTQVFVFPTEKEAQKSGNQDENGLYYPGLFHSPYSSILVSEQDLFARVKIAYTLLNNKKCNIYVSYQALFLNLLGMDFFNSQGKITIKAEDIIAPQELAETLVRQGYNCQSQIVERGDFAKRGEVFDIYPFSGKPIRLQYFDDLIEHIFEIDLETQRSKKDCPIPQVSLEHTLNILSREPFSKNFKSRFKRPTLQYNHLNQWRADVFNHLSEGRLFPNYSLYAPLFSSQPTSLFQIINGLPTSQIIIFKQDEVEYESSLLREKLEKDFNENKENTETLVPLFPPESFYHFQSFTPHLLVDEIYLENPAQEKSLNHIRLAFEPSFPHYNGSKHNLSFQNPKNRYQFLQNIAEFLIKFFSKKGQVFLLFKYLFTQEELIKNLKNYGVSKELLKRITFSNKNLCEGFYDQSRNIILISEYDFSSSGKKTAKPAPTTALSQDYFTEQISHLHKGDLVIHAEYGVGEYQGLEKLNMGGSESDFLVIHYRDGDKVYVPVYKIHLVQKHSQGEVSPKLDSLRSQKFLQAKKKARKAVKELAFDLIELQAQRKMQEGFSFSSPNEDFRSFEINFPYTETPDQGKAIERVCSDMEKTIPMDRLICGDVGFGKTEVAMRAAFKAVLDSKQVVILVPTTILSLQHYNSFIQRFKKFPVTIDFLSRLKTPKQAREISEQLKEGKIDIIIGTHRLLSSQVKYKNLGLLIIDEEHRFGVAHKEKIKLLKSNIDVLTLTATPIPRTLQLAQLGLRDISIIQTPPPRRQSIQTFIIREDEKTIREAIGRELKRGGQVYFVHNRVRDIELVASKVQKMAPKAKIIIAHGQLAERELEKRIQKFYNGEADILIATTIVESGIDIPMANTMIVNKADKFGLAQLHQLRGRIGRSERKAYAYLIVQAHKKIGDNAQKRLKALQTFSEMGSGFSIASSDLDIRGAGNILGGEQSGHIFNIGLELYLELLKEAIEDLKGKKEPSIQHIEIQTHFPSYIPSTHIPDHAQRLRYYKRFSKSQNLEEIHRIKDEIIDLYGKISDETLNLVSVFELRLMAQKLLLDSIKTQKKHIRLKFNESSFEANPEVRDKILNFILSRPRLFKLSPDFTATYSPKNQQEVDKDTLFQVITGIAEEI